MKALCFRLEYEGNVLVSLNLCKKQGYLAVETAC